MIQNLESNELTSLSLRQRGRTLLGEQGLLPPCQPAVKNEIKLADDSGCGLNFLLPAELSLQEIKCVHDWIQILKEGKLRKI